MTVKIVSIIGKVLILLIFCHVIDNKSRVIAEYFSFSY